MKFELTVTAINGLSDNGFSGMMVVKNGENKIVRRKGINGATKAEVEREAKELFAELDK